MSSIVIWTRQHRLVAFVGLAFAVSWWVWPLYVLGLSPTPFFACGPLVAALVVIGIAEGRSGYRALGARMLRWRIGWTWWAVALGMPLAVLAVAALANVTIWGAPTPVLADVAWSNAALVFAVRFVQPLDGPLGEEPGFRGYALPHMQAEHSPLVAGAQLGGIVALWHVPIIAVGALPPIALVVTFAITLVYVWLFNRTGGSVLMTLVFHVAQGTITYAALGFTGDDAARMDWLTGSLWCVMAAGVIAFDRQAWRVAPPGATAGPAGTYLAARGETNRAPAGKPPGRHSAGESDIRGSRSAARRAFSNDPGSQACRTVVQSLSAVSPGLGLDPVPRSLSGS